MVTSSKYSSAQSISGYLLCGVIACAGSGCGGGGDAPSPVNVESVSTSRSAPTISGTPATTATVGTSYSFQPSASDTGGGTLTFGIDSKPSWAAFNTITGQLSGTPTTADVGTTGSITISVSDGGQSAALQPFQIQVSASSTSSGHPDDQRDAPNASPGRPSLYVYSGCERPRPARHSVSASRTSPLGPPSVSRQESSAARPRMRTSGPTQIFPSASATARQAPRSQHSPLGCSGFDYNWNRDRVLDPADNEHERHSADRPRRIYDQLRE